MKSIDSVQNIILQTLGSFENDGYIQPHISRILRRAMNKNQFADEEMSPVPEQYFGPFDSLPDKIRHAIVKTIVKEDHWSMVGHDIGKWHILVVHMMTRLRRSFSGHGFKRLARLSHALAVMSRSGPAHVLHKMHRLRASFIRRFSNRLDFLGLLNLLGIEPWDLSVCYARNIPQQPAYRGFYHDANRHNSYGVVVGIDLLPTPDGYYFIESNLNFGMSSTRSALYDRDPFVTDLVDFAADMQYQHLMFLSNTSSYVNNVMAEQLSQAASSRNIKLSIVEDGYLPKSKHMQSFGIPTLSEDRTLVVRTRFYRTSLDHLFQNKRANNMALRQYRQYSSDPDVLVPDTEIGSADERDPFPNIVYKMPERDEGKGIAFLKAQSSAHAQELLNDYRRNGAARFMDRLYSIVEDSRGIYQAYVKPLMLDGRFVYKIRSHVLITPIGMRFLSAHRVISGFAVPATLPFGIVQDPKPYLVNLASSSKYELLPAEEEEQVIKSSLAIARGLSWAASYGFQSMSA